MRKQSGIILLLGLGVYIWLELEALIFLGQIVGGFPSFIGIFLTAFAGIYFIRRLSRKVFMAWQPEPHKNKSSLSKLAEGLSILLGSLLLVIPGYLTDIIGVILMVPIIRSLVGGVIIANFADLKLFSDLRKKNEFNASKEENLGNNSSIITIDGNYTEK